MPCECRCGPQWTVYRCMVYGECGGMRGCAQKHVKHLGRGDELARKNLE